MARVLLVQPHEDRTNEYNRRRINTPINLIVVGTAIEDKHEVKIYDRNLDIDDEKFVRFLKKYNPEKLDIWACGIILYELIYLYAPWEIARKTDENYSDYYYFFITREQLLPRLFRRLTYNTLFYNMLHPHPSSRSNIHYILQLLNELDTEMN